MSCCCPTPLCPQVALLPQGGAITANDFSVVFDPTLGCNAGLKLKKLPNENEVLKGAGAPTVPPADPTENKTWFDTTSSQLTHYWDSTTNAWVPIVGTFPVIKKCDNTNAIATDRFLTATAGATTSSNQLGGSTPTSRQLWSFANDGSGCPSEVTAPAAPCTDATIPTGNVFLGGLADGTIGFVRGSQVERPVFRSVAAAATLDPTVEQGIIITAAGVITLATPVATALCTNTLVWVKRTSNDPTVVVRVTAPAGIDGAPGNTIQLGTSSKFGTLTGEGAWFQFDGTTWRIVAAY